MLTCAGVTTYKAVKLAGARPGSLVAIFGIGGLGHLALQYAKISGASVVAVDISDEKLELAKELGADYVVNALTEDPVKAIKALGGAHAAISVAVAPKAFEQAFGCAAPRRHADLRRAAGRQPGQPADLRDRAERHHRPRVHRRHPQGPRRGVRHPRGRAAPG